MSVYHNRPALIAFSDATGALGGRVARRLASAGQVARAIMLDADHDADLPEMEVVEASYRDPASMRRALGGVHTFFMIPVHEAPDRVQQHVSAVDAAVATGVKRIVYSSFVGAARGATFTFAPGSLAHGGAHPQQRLGLHVLAGQRLHGRSLFDPGLGRCHLRPRRGWTSRRGGA
jgi:nucleoside-diphosphate-sugar epimerase